MIYSSGMRRFLIWLVSGAGVFLFAITEIYPDFGTPAIRTVFKVGGIVLFVGAWLYVAVERALGLAHEVKEMRGVMAKAKKTLKNNPALAEQARRVNARSPFKNFLLSLLFTGVAAGFLAFGIFINIGFFTIVHRVIWIAMSGVFLVVGLATAAWHLMNMVRGK